MNIHLKETVMLLLATLICVASSCSESKSEKDPEGDEPIDEISASDFVGYWELLDADIDAEFNYVIFKSDRTGWVLSKNSDSKTNETWHETQFIWSYRNSILKIKGDINADLAVIKITNKTFIAVDESGEGDDYSFVRIKKTDIPNYNNQHDDDDGKDDDDDKDDNGNGNGNDNHGDAGITTLTAAPKAYSAILSGQYSGSKMPESVGFQYSYDNSFPEKYSKSVSTDGTFGGFELNATGIIDQIKVYYRAFAIVDGKTYYGETKDFTTKQGTYSIDGKTYKFIKVTGLPTGSFSMMQTELPPNAEFMIDGKLVGRLNKSLSDPVTKGETRDFMNDWGLVPRYPTPKEWIYAASGGNSSKGFLYSGSNNIEEVAWYSDNSDGYANNVALKSSNELGFYDMSGNYGELCALLEDDQLKAFMEHTLKFTEGVENISAKLFNDCWDAIPGAFGGNWSSSASLCRSNSSDKNAAPTQNRIQSHKYTIRFVYSRPD